MTDTKVMIVATFHRFVYVEEGRPERKEIFTAGQVVTVSGDDAADWIAKGLAKAVETPRESAFREPIEETDPA